MNKVQEFKEIINELNKNDNEDGFLLKAKEIQYISRILLVYAIFKLFFYSGNSVISSFLNLFSILIYYYSSLLTYDYNNKDESLKKYTKNYEWVTILFIWSIIEFLLFFYDSQLYELESSENIYKQAFSKFAKVVKITHLVLLGFLVLIHSLFLYK